MNLSASHIKDPTFKKIAQKTISEMKRLDVPGVESGSGMKAKNMPMDLG